MCFSAPHYSTPHVNTKKVFTYPSAAPELINVLSVWNTTAVTLLETAPLGVALFFVRENFISVHGAVCEIQD